MFLILATLIQSYQNGFYQFKKVKRAERGHKIFIRSNSENRDGASDGATADNVATISSNNNDDSTTSAHGTYSNTSNSNNNNDGAILTASAASSTLDLSSTADISARASNQIRFNLNQNPSNQVRFSNKEKWVFKNTKKAAAKENDKYFVPRT